MVVSWDNTDEGREGGQVPSDGQARPIATDPSILDGHSGDDDDGAILFHLARQERWEQLLSRLKSVSPEALWHSTDPTSEYDDEQDNILHAVTGILNVPVGIVQAILDRATATNDRKSHNTYSTMQCNIDLTSTNLAAKRNHLQQAPLHVAVVTMPERTEIIECLYRACPDSVQARDSLRLRPIDILTQKIIMMEEVIKYARKKHEKEEGKEMLNGLWDAVHVLVGANSGSTYLVHACLRTKEVPFALTERAMKYNEEQLALPDSNGDLPLHVVSRIPPPIHPRSQAASSEETSQEVETEDDEGDFLERAIGLNPEAAYRFNNDQQLPIAVAVRAGRKWNSGIFDLLRANPSGIEGLHLPLNLFPTLIELLTFQPSTLFRMLQSLPGLFMACSAS